MRNTEENWMIKDGKLKIYAIAGNLLLLSPVLKYHLFCTFPRCCSTRRKGSARSEDNWDLVPNKYIIHIFSGRISNYSCLNYYIYALEIITGFFLSWFFFSLGGIKTPDYKQRKFGCSLGLLVSWTLFALLPGLQKRIWYHVMLFGLSEWKSGLLQRNFSSFLLRNIPEKGNAKIPSSHRPWALQGASLPRLLSFLPLPAEKKKKKEFTGQPSPHPSKTEFKRSLGSWPGKASSFSSPFLNQGWASGEPWRESVGELRFFICRSNPERSQQEKLESGWESGDGCLKWQRSFSIAAVVPAKPGQWLSLSTTLLRCFWRCLTQELTKTAEIYLWGVKSSQHELIGLRVGQGSNKELYSAGRLCLLIALA